MKQFLRRFLPKQTIVFYHWLLAKVAGWLYCNPSKKMVIIGVTGTNGKSTTSDMIAHVLHAGGYKVGLASTVKFRIGDKVIMNDTKMTMLGRFALQKLLHRMYKAGCTHVVVETSSQGIEQFRHASIYYDYTVFTNLTPEHIEAHGSFENYKNAKLKLFTHTAKLPCKRIDGEDVLRIAIGNTDNEHAPDFLDVDGFDLSLGYGQNSLDCYVDRDYCYTDRDYLFFINEYTSHINFTFEGQMYHLGMLGTYNVYNMIPALIIGEMMGMKKASMAAAVQTYKGLEGRMEIIDEGQDFHVVVDYAPEPYALQGTYEGLREQLSYHHMIHVLGSAGGGRDIARRPILGEMAGKTADIAVVTNEDPYLDDPQEIIDQVAQGAIDAGAKLDKDVYKILDRKEAIHFALDKAKPGSLVLVTGKGSEQAMATKDGLIPWDDREVIREYLQSKK
jgi:UDP-N-acetylmuramoyl-L-alanyl-D-glutamate--2,6-diaminopimelate ligase